MTLGEVSADYERLRRVARGVYVLDEVRPGWRDDIAMDALDMNSRQWCILGQLYGDYYKGIDELFPKQYGKQLAVGFNDSPEYHGFQTVACETPEQLKEAWRALI